jgi:hypothetical protein
MSLMLSHERPPQDIRASPHGLPYLAQIITKNQEKVKSYLVFNTSDTPLINARIEPRTQSGPSAGGQHGENALYSQGFLRLPASAPNDAPVRPIANSVGTICLLRQDSTPRGVVIRRKMETGSESQGLPSPKPVSNSIGKPFSLSFSFCPSMVVDAIRGLSFSLPHSPRCGGRFCPVGNAFRQKLPSGAKGGDVGGFVAVHKLLM